MIHFTADNHFFHDNIIWMTDRPFTHENMTEEMIALWNAAVSPGDLVYQIGDFSLGKYEKTVQVIGQLNGDIRFIIPHDHHDKWLKKWIRMGVPPIDTRNGKATYFHQMYVLKLKALRKDGYSLKIAMNHYPWEHWEASYHGSIHLHGHSHGNAVHRENRLDVGIDCWGFAPVTISEVIHELKLLKKGWQWV